MNETLKRDWGLVVAGIAMVVIGIAFVLIPGLTLIVVAAIAGVALLVSGVLDIIAYVRRRNELDLNGWTIAAAALDIALGLVMVIHPLVSAVVIPWIAAVAFAVYGVLEIIAAWRLAVSQRGKGKGYTQVADIGSAVSSLQGGVRVWTRDDSSPTHWGWSLFGGLVALACAVVFFLAPESFALFLAFFMMARGVVAIAHGLSVGSAAREGHHSAA